MSGFPHTAAAWARLRLAWQGYCAAVRRDWSVRALQIALRLDARAVLELSAAGIAAAGFTIHKDGREFGVFLNGERISSAEERGRTGVSDKVPGRKY